MNKTYLLLLALSLFTVSCKTKEILWDEECARRYPVKTEYIIGKDYYHTDTVKLPGILVNCDPIILKTKCPDNLVITKTVNRIDTVIKSNTAQISLLEREKKELQQRLHSSQKQTLEALKIVDEYRAERNKARTQRNIAIFGIGLLTLWSLRKILSKIISPFL